MLWYLVLSFGTTFNNSNPVIIPQQSYAACAAEIKRLNNDNRVDASICVAGGPYHVYSQ